MALVLDMTAPVLIASVALYGMFRRVDVYGAKVQGAADGLGVLLRIVPSLIALLTAVWMLRASGALELLAERLGYSRQQAPPVHTAAAPPSEDILLDISEALQVPLERLIAIK